MRRASPARTRSTGGSASLGRFAPRASRRRSVRRNCAAILRTTRSHGRGDSPSSRAGAAARASRSLHDVAGLLVVVDEPAREPHQVECASSSSIAGAGRSSMRRVKTPRLTPSHPSPESPGLSIRARQYLGAPRATPMRRSTTSSTRRAFPPTVEFRATARLASEITYQRMYAIARRSREFWGRVAQELPWLRP